MAALSFNNNRRQKTTTTTAWSTQRQPLLVRKQFSFIETAGGSNFNSGYSALHISSNRGGRGGPLTRGLSVGRSYDGIRQKLNAPSVSLRHAGSQAYLQRQITFDHDLKFRNNTKPKESHLKNSRAVVLNNSNTRLNCTRSNSNGGDSSKFKQKGIVAWSSTSSLLKSFDDDNLGYLRTRNSRADGSVDKKINDTRKTLTTTSNTANSHHQRSHSLAKGEASKINLSIILPQAAKTSVDETVLSDIESSLDSGVDTDTASSQPSKLSAVTKIKQPTTTAPNIATTSTNNTANYRRAQFRASRIDTSTVETPSPTASPIITTATITATTTNLATSKDNPIQNSPSVTNALNTTSITNAPTATTTTTFSASPSLIVQRRPPLVRAMSAPVRPLDDSSKGAFAANKRKPRRRKIITRNISCDKTTEQEFLTTEIINGKKVLTRSRSVVSTDVVTLVSLMSSEGSDSEKEDSALPTGNSAKSETSPVRRAPSLRKTGKSVSFQENYPPNFQLASKEYSHMIRRGSIAPLTARLRTNRPPTAPPVSIFMNMSNSTEALAATARTVKTNVDASPPSSNDVDKRTPMSEKPNTNNNKEMSTNNNSSAEQNDDYVFPDYVRSIKERECWKLHQKMCNKGVNVSYDTILRGMLTPTEFRQIQKQRELEEAKARELAEAENEGENVKPQSAIDRLSEALLKK